MLSLPWIFKLNNYISYFFSRSPPWKCFPAFWPIPFFQGGSIMDYFNTYREMISLRGLTDHTVKAYSTYIRSYLHYLQTFRKRWITYRIYTIFCLWDNRSIRKEFLVYSYSCGSWCSSLTPPLVPFQISIRWRSTVWNIPAVPARNGWIWSPTAAQAAWPSLPGVRHTRSPRGLMSPR